MPHRKMGNGKGPPHMDVRGASAPRRPAPPPAPDPAQGRAPTRTGTRLRTLDLTGSSTMNSARENGVPLPSHTPALPCDGCTARPSFATLDTWCLPTNGYSIPSVGRRSSTRRDWQKSSARPHATVHRAPTDLLADGIAGRVSHGTPHLPSSLRYYLTAKGIGEGAKTLGFDMSSDFVRGYHSSREWLALLIRRMDAVASVNVIRYGIRWLRRLMHRGWGWLLPEPGLEPKPGLSVIHHAPTRSAVRARSSAELPTAIAHQTRARKVVRQTHDIRVVR